MKIFMKTNQPTQFLLQAIRQVKSLRLKFYRGNSPSSLNIRTSNGISPKKILVFSSVLYYKHVMQCVIWYHLYNLKNVKNTHWRVLLLLNFQAKKLATLLKVTLLQRCFSCLLNCANGPKSHKTNKCKWESTP